MYEKDSLGLDTSPRGLASKSRSNHHHRKNPTYRNRYFLLWAAKKTIGLNLHEAISAAANAVTRNDSVVVSVRIPALWGATYTSSCPPFSVREKTSPQPQHSPLPAKKGLRYPRHRSRDDLYHFYATEGFLGSERFCSPNTPACPLPLCV